MTDLRTRRRICLGIIALSLVALLMAACGGGSDDPEPTGDTTPAEQAVAQADASTEQADVPAEQAAEQTDPADEADAVEDSVRGSEGGSGRDAAPANGAVRDLTGVEGAVVRIVAQGSFRDPDVGELLNVAGSGSGFLISESGLVVTNNHVVTGAAFLEVFFGGDETNPINARILGVSECSDLAVIDLEGVGYPFLEWHEGVITVGLAAFAAGFPLGDPEFTLTSGIVGKASADGESSWASVDRVLEHDAAILPGNSGGPLVTQSGRVIGINYAGTDLGQNFAIRADEAKRILDRLINGDDVTSIGVNGQAIQVNIDSQLVTGVWVASVASGSPADDVGLASGDIITRMEGLLLAEDGSMASYCDILRTRGSDDVLAIEVLRASSGQVLEGRLNSGEQLSESFSFGAIGGDLGGGVVSGATYSGFAEIMDDTGNLAVEVPVEWTDVQGGPWVLDGEDVGISVTAAASIEQFFGVWTEPGVFVGASTQLPTDANDLLDNLRGQFPFDQACEYEGRQPYEDPLYAGVFDTWLNCGGDDVVYISLVAGPPDESFVINVQVQIVSDADFEALDRILNSFFVQPPGNVAAPPPEEETGYGEFVEITDDSGGITVVVPVAWAETSGTAWTFGGEVVGVGLSASTDIQLWQDRSWDVPGIFVGASSTIGTDPGAFLDALDFSSSCDFVGRETYQDPLYSGFQDVWSDCGGVGTTFIVVAAVPEDSSFLVEVQMQLVSDADVEALERALATFIARPPS